MATKKDLVEAHAFSRRRLVTAFLSGAPGGREVEPARPARTVVGGLALAILLVAGAAIASVLASRTDENWNQIGLVVNQQTAAQYVILKKSDHPTLIPVENITSAQLILGVDRVKPRYVDEKVIEDQTPGTTIGIFGAPQLLPQPSQFIEQGWTSCTDQGLAMTLDLSRSQHTTAQQGHGAVVDTVDPATGAKHYYLIARSSVGDGALRRTYAYPMPPSGRLDQALRDVGLAAEANAIEVPPAWVGLFPAGGALTAASFPIADYGQPPPTDVAKYLPPGTTVGQYYESGSRGLVITDGGTVELDPFSLAVYKETVWRTGRQREQPKALSAAPDDQLRGAKQIFADAHWPDSRLEPVTGQLCAQLDVHADQAPRVSLRSDPTSVVAASQDSATTDRPEFSIDRGQGAYVMVGDWNDVTSDSRAVIDPRGTVYTLLGADTITNLGYDVVKPPLVPDTWVRLMAPGVALSTNAALCPPNVAGSDGGSAATAAGDGSAGSAVPSAGAPTAQGDASTCQTAVP